MKNGYWFNFGKGFCHLANDDFSQMLTGAASRLFWEPVGAGCVSIPLTGGADPAERSPVPLPGAECVSIPLAGSVPLQGHWKLVIDATAHVTGAVVNVWTGMKSAGNDPAGQYTRVAGCDPVAMLTVA